MDDRYTTKVYMLQYILGLHQALTLLSVSDQYHHFWWYQNQQSMLYESSRLMYHIHLLNEFLHTN